jgi:hypothetical protein
VQHLEAGVEDVADFVTRAQWNRVRADVADLIAAARGAMRHVAKAQAAPLVRAARRASAFEDRCATQ